jgi:hypothetical protein
MKISTKSIKSTTFHCHRLQDKHLQFNIHSLYEYKIPKILVLQSYTILTQRNNLENYAQDICILFMAWCTNFDIKIDFTISWQMTLINLYPTFTNIIKK